MYVVEIACTVAYSLTFVSDLATKGALHIGGHQIYGYTIVVDVVGMLSWACSLLMLHRERILIVTSKPHGFTLTLFWLVGVVWLGLEVVSYYGTAWWWHLASRADIADLAIFVIRAVLLLVLVVVGLCRQACSPGGRRQAYALPINADEAETVDVDAAGSRGDSRKAKEGDFVRSRTSSTFENMWGKVRMLFPYVWPKGIR